MLRWFRHGELKNCKRNSRGGGDCGSVGRLSGPSRSGLHHVKLAFHNCIAGQPWLVRYDFTL